jgi:SAM-dependent methyltransferase
MSVKNHYDNHLAEVYSWFSGNFELKKEQFKKLCGDYGVVPSKNNASAFDLGAGHGIQTIALSELGFKVNAIDFNSQLLEELSLHKGSLAIETILDDLRHFKRYVDDTVEVIACCGDTIAHLASEEEIKQLIIDTFAVMAPGGRIIITFRDYSVELKGTSRFIPVKSDDKRILTCILEFFPGKVSVTDLLHELIDGKWVQKVSSYDKVRTTQEMIQQYLVETGYLLLCNENSRGWITLIGSK